MKNITESMGLIRDRIGQVEQQFGRISGSVRLVAVSKTRPVMDILSAVAQGQYDFGENYIQEAMDKIAEMDNPEITWHFIGPVQSNKTRLVAQHFHWVHSIDRIKTAQRLNDARPTHLPPLNVCLQVNIDREAGKSGITADTLPALLDACDKMPGLKIRGLMALPRPHNDFESQCVPFRELKCLFDSVKSGRPDFDTLSMGTTNDFVAAIAEGSTMIRVGTAIFGERS